MAKPLAFIIEDDPQLSQIFQLSLEKEFEVQPIINGDEALVRLAMETPRVIVLDLNLPNVSGVEILGYIRAEERLRNVSVILCTADDRLAAPLENKADLVLLKPVSPVQLREMASRLK
jgi:two-component system, OmpR family, phosphate regulon response regulator PhoB